MSSSNDDSIWAQTAQAVATSWPRPRWCDVGVVVACSGGADSVALVRVLAELHEQHQDSRGTLAIAHFNHGLRGQEADGDQEFVRRLAGQLSLRLLTSRGTGEHQDASTLRQERLRKLADYRTLASVQEILIAFHGERRVTLQRRSSEGWRVEELMGQASIALAPCESPIPLDALYREPGPSGA